MLTLLIFSLFPHNNEPFVTFASRRIISPKGFFTLQGVSAPGNEINRELSEILNSDCRIEKFDQLKLEKLASYLRSKECLLNVVHLAALFHKFHKNPLVLQRLISLDTIAMIFSKSDTMLYSANEIWKCLYGLQKFTLNHSPRISEILCTLASKIGNSSCILDGQGISMSIYGLQVN